MFVKTLSGEALCLSARHRGELSTTCVTQLVDKVVRFAKNHNKDLEVFGVHCPLSGLQEQVVAVTVASHTPSDTKCCKEALPVLRRV